MCQLCLRVFFSPLRVFKQSQISLKKKIQLFVIYRRDIKDIRTGAEKKKGQEKTPANSYKKNTDIINTKQNRPNEKVCEIIKKNNLNKCTGKSDKIAISNI